MSTPTVRALCLHTGGTYWVDVVATSGAQGADARARWLAGGPRLELGDGVEPALDAIMASQPQPVAASWFRLSPPGPTPGGTSGDLVLVAAALLRVHAHRLIGGLPDPGAQLEGDAPLLIVTGSGTLRLGVDGRVRVGPIEGWPDKLAQLARVLREHPAARAIVLAHPSQQPELDALTASSGLDDRIEVRVLDSPSQLDRVLDSLFQIPAHAAPSDWPPSHPSATAVLEAAEKLARQPDLGYIAVSHLAAAYVGPELDGPVSTWLRAHPVERFRPLGVGALALAGPSGPLVPTPRLVELQRAMRPNFDAEALARALVLDPWSPLHRAAGYDLGIVARDPQLQSTLRTMETWRSEHAGVATSLQVLGGPEDGRHLRLAPGDTVGRSAEERGPTVALYEATRLRDLGLSRQHVRWEGPGLIRALRPIRHERLGVQTTRPAGAPVAVQGGDVLLLTPDTLLRGLPVEPWVHPILD